MARLDFEQGTERGDAFVRIGNKNRVGRKHNHQARGRAREKQRQNMLKGKEVDRARLAKKVKRFKMQVAAYWRGEVDAYPERPA